MHIGASQKNSFYQNKTNEVLTNYLDMVTLRSECKMAPSDIATVDPNPTTLPPKQWEVC